MQNIQSHTGTKSILNYFFKKAKVLNYLLLFPPKTQATLPFSQNKPETVKKYIILALPFIVQIKMLK